ncbi:hypothetical protein [Neglectibacter timonensis]|uniref:hypothetical protein n=1 Tax=Neglectibacter timonensis TaxID=1776382 RepID=UPI0032194FFC
MAEAENHSYNVESGASFGKIDLRENQPERAGRYLPTGNHSGCNTVYIPKYRCIL